jgi:alpha-glucosidase (family GH31 glycosyl hydrolase)
MDLMKVSIQRKYHLIRYYYTEMMQVSMANNTFYTFYKPMFFEFPEDKEAYNDIANNVMIGEAIKTSVNAKSATQNLTSFYFPAGTWCSLFEPIGQCVSSDKGHWLEMDSHLDKSYAHLRERFIVPMQNATALKAMTTYDLQQAPVDLHILGSFAVPGVMSWTAVGTYLNDDGVTTMQSGNTNQYRFNAQYSQVGGETLTLTISQTEIAANYLDKSTNCSAVNKADYLQSIYVYNAAAFKQHDSLYVSVAYTDDIDNYKVIGTATYDKDTNRIVYDGSVLGNLLCLTRVFRIQFKNLAPVTE